MSDKSELVQKAEQVLLQMIDKAAEIGSAAVDEIPLVVQELLHWKFAESLLMSIGGFILLWLVYLSNKWAYHNSKELDVGIVFFWVAGIIATCCSIIMINIDWLQILIAPRVYLLEYAAQLMK